MLRFNDDWQDTNNWATTAGPDDEDEEDEEDEDEPDESEEADDRTSPEIVEEAVDNAIYGDE